ncbi:MAG TPA: hypothetical protein VFE52_08705 [Devosia sp.]|jgi:hypothetical protein|nr:hypothetical protein [Devosia sp.]
MASASAHLAAPATTRPDDIRPFLGLIDPVLLDAPANLAFEGAVTADHARAAWIWMARDLAPDLLGIRAVEGMAADRNSLDSMMPDLLARARSALADGQRTAEATRRLKAQLGGEEVWARVPVVLNALRCRNLLGKAQSFGRAANGIADESALALALQSMPLQEAAVGSLLMTAAVGQVAAPARLVSAAVRIAGSDDEQDLARAGFGALLDACFAHAQNQIPALSQMGTFGDMDLVCRSVDRFHRLVRAVTGYVDLSRNGRRAAYAAALTKAASDRLEPKLRNVGADMNMALRRRDGADRVDPDQILAAMNGVYLLGTVRDSRDSLAVNAVFDQVWGQSGQALEIHIERNLEAVRRNPADAPASARLDAALKMAEIRFGHDYAETMRRARDVAERRL